MSGHERAWKRRYVWQAAGGRCASCGCECTRAPGRRRGTIDHVRPLSRGGTHELVNLQLLCESCNRRKGDRWPGRQVHDDMSVREVEALHDFRRSP